MKIELNSVSKERGITKIGEFTISSTLAFRFLKDTNKTITKFRNIDYENTGRILKLNDIQAINQLNIDGEIYNNLKYLSHEIYIHAPRDEEITTSNMIEDLNITFEKVGENGK
ncbi:hypothetical protein [Fusobacterium ulcerans]|uniref:hypothetical protein n=1 Tax=Fusobacterium ulcerans TaxID=861 RepID=UPI0030A281A2